MYEGVKVGTVRKKGEVSIRKWGTVVCLVSSGERRYRLASDNSLPQVEPTAKEVRWDNFLKHRAPAVQPYLQP